MLCTACTYLCLCLPIQQVLVYDLGEYLAPGLFPVPSSVSWHGSMTEIYSMNERPKIDGRTEATS